MTDKLLILLPSLYDAAIDTGKWEEALDNIVDYVGGKSAMLFAVQDKFQSFNLAKGGGTLKGRADIFADYSHRFRAYEEEAMAHFAKSVPQSLIREVDLWPDLDALRVRPDFQYVRDHLGAFRRVGTRLNGNPAWFDGCTVHFSDELEEIPRANLALISSVLPSLAKVVELNRFFHVLQAKYQAALAALDKVRIGICIVDPRGHIVVANEEVERIFTLRDGVASAANQTILCTDQNATAAIKSAVAMMSQTASGQNDRNAVLLAVVRRSGAKPFLIEVVPLRDALREIDRGFAGAMVSIIDPENVRAFSTRNVSKLYGLTPTEADVCRLLVDGLTNEDIAETRNVSVETVRSQTKAIYRKLNVTGRADLIREVLTVNPPIG